MSESLQYLRQKIDSASDLGGVVRTMKALAASSIAQYERAVQSLDDYHRTVELGLVACLRQIGGRLPLGTARAITLCAVVFGSDQGLVGQFNEALSEFAAHRLRALGGTARVLTVGERVREHLAAQGLDVVAGQTVPTSIAAVTATVARILGTLEAQCGSGHELHVHLFHNRPRAAAQYASVTQRLLPLDAAWQRRLTRRSWPTRLAPQVIGAPAEALQVLLREHLFISLFRACTESLASENASRLEAMQRAEENIDELLHGLQRDFHQQRQSNTDAELFDVLAGFEAVGGHM